MKAPILILTALLLIPPAATPHLAAQEGDVPALISYQGKLVQINGDPYADGNHPVTFRLYDAPAGGTLIWGATYTIPVINGLFSVALGAPGGGLLPNIPVTDLRFAFGSQDRYLELEVDGNILLPRQQLLSVPYALQALQAEMLIKEYQDALCPPGTILAFGGRADAIPAGWLLCDGSALMRADYPRLHDAILKNWGDGSEASPGARAVAVEGQTDFNLPDLRGFFLRGVSDVSGRDPNTAARTRSNPGGAIENQVGTVQGSAFRRHSHLMSIGREGLRPGVEPSSRIYYGESNNGRDTTSNYLSVEGGDETRPINAAVNYIIKY